MIIDFIKKYISSKENKIKVCIEIFIFLAIGIGYINDSLSFFGSSIKYIAIVFLIIFIIFVFLKYFIKIDGKMFIDIIIFSAIGFILFLSLFIIQKTSLNENIIVKESFQTITSPYSNNQITGILKKQQNDRCFTQYDQGEHFIWELDYKTVVQAMQQSLVKEMDKLSYKELSESECRLAFRLSHIDDISAIKYYRSALISDSENIGALLGLELLRPDYKNNIVQAYKIAEKNKEISAFPYILYIDAIRKHQNEDYKNRDNLIDTGLKISTELNMANMVDRFNELRIVYQIKNKSPDEAKVLLQNKIGECNNRELYIGNLEKPPNLR